MKIKIIVDQFCHRKGIKQYQSFDHTPIAQELYEFLGGSGKFEDIDRLMKQKL